MSHNIDDKLRNHIQSLLEKSKDLQGYQLQVEVIEGTVHLQGIVDTLKEKKRAAQIVRGVMGVKGVNNGITISTDGEIDGKDAGMEVREELEEDPRVNTNHIGAECRGGHGNVVLKGNTDDPAEIEAAQEAASQARGVTRVLNQVSISEKELSLEEIFHSQVNNDVEPES
ncbi:BON domain-containing protein [Syntrophomonas erecta]